TEHYKDVVRLGLNVTSELKFIPDSYKNASSEQRFQILQGLFDTDGTVNKSSAVSFSTASFTLAKDVQELVRSLGGTATISEKFPFYKNKDGDKVLCRKSYTLYIRHPNARKLFKLSRKVSRCKDKKIGNRVVSVEKLGIKDLATCI